MKKERYAIVYNYKNGEFFIKDEENSNDKKFFEDYCKGTNHNFYNIVEWFTDYEDARNYCDYMNE